MKVTINSYCQFKRISALLFVCTALIRDNKEAVAQNFKRIFAQIRVCCKYKRLFVDASQHIHHISMHRLLEDQTSAVTFGGGHG